MPNKCYDKDSDIYLVHELDNMTVHKSVLMANAYWFNILKIIFDNQKEHFIFVFAMASLVLNVECICYNFGIIIAK